MNARSIICVKLGNTRENHHMKMETETGGSLRTKRMGDHEGQEIQDLE